MQKLLFIHNTDSGIINSISSYVRRQFSSNHPCNLYVITQGPLGVRGEWKRFIRKLDARVERLHRDEFVAKHPAALIKRYPSAISYPCVAVRSGDSLAILISAEEIAGCKTLDELIDLTTAKLLGLGKAGLGK